MRARVLAATGDIPAAIAMMDAALDRLPATGVPYLRASVLVELARLQEQVGNQAAGRVEAKRAAASLTGLDVVLPAGDVALLDRLGVAAPTAGSLSAAHTATLRRQDRCWTVAFGASRARLNDTKGLRYLAELLRSPGVERHALDLVDGVAGLDAGQASLDRRNLGDAGELVDARARMSYRHRIEELWAEIDDALDAGAEEHAETLQAELDQLVGQLAQAFGLGGRSRRASSASERARVNVTRALRAATNRLIEVLPEAGTVVDFVPGSTAPTSPTTKFDGLFSPE